MAAIVRAADGLLLAVYRTLAIEKVRALHEPMGDTVEEVEDEETLAKDLERWGNPGDRSRA